MSNFILAHEPTIRLTVFLGLLIAMAAWEALAPRRQRLVSRWVRWPGNLGVVALNAAIARLAFPVAAVGLAAFGEQHGWGLLNNVVLPGGAKIVLAVFLLDLAIYLQHVLFHAVPALWRLHRMHHADLDFDVTTGARFHPIEILLSMALKFAVVSALGAPAAAVVVFEVLLNATSMFNHGNVGLPAELDRLLRWIVVTPDMHRVHHSVVANETNSNFGFNLPWWDRLLGTYRAQPAAGHEAMTIGLDDFRDPGQLRLDRMLVQPFSGKAGQYPINRRDWRARANRQGVAAGAPWIEPERLVARLQEEPTPIIVDVREPNEFAGELGPLPGARNLPLGAVALGSGELSPFKEREVVLVCRTQMRSAKAASILEDAGFAKVAVLRGGMVEWARRQFPIERAAPSSPTPRDEAPRTC
jgi:sterol desaturase/sphingolipid hydroxylase (fatty acid hydroxylase superfamily)/rhodanese-related sulfurtransferase